MEQKPINEMTLAECNAELLAAGVSQPKKRIDHARNLVQAIRNGKTTGQAAAEKSAQRAVRKTRKTAVAAPGQPALTEEQAENTKTEPDKGGEEAPVAKTKKSNKKAPKVRKARTGAGKSIIPDAYRSQYKKVKGVKTESGAPAVHCGDGLAGLMAGLDNDAIAKVGRENKVDVAKWSKLNPGQVRMNLGNVLRGMIRRGEKVTVQGKTAKL
jgi:hypothetical protein